MTSEKVVMVANDMVTAYGWGIEACWEGLFSNRSAIKPIRHFGAETTQKSAAGIVDELDVKTHETRVMAMLKPLLQKSEKLIPKDSLCLLATTLGEIEYLENSVLNQQVSEGESCPAELLSKIEEITSLQKPGIVFSAACCSSTIAIAEGAAMIADRKESSVLVVACDSVSEFLYAGFSSLLVIDSEQARPFDQNRKGLNIGEAAGFILLMSEARALLEGRKILGEIVGWGMSNDANHMTGPSRNGECLAKAILQALENANIDRKAVASISAHGTGTVYNDAMEIKAFKTAFENQALPTYSMKGAIGHTMAAAGLIEALIAFKSLSQQKIPSTVGIQQVDAEAVGWISTNIQKASGCYALSTNSGFGGVNAALILKGREA